MAICFEILFFGLQLSKCLDNLSLTFIKVPVSEKRPGLKWADGLCLVEWPNMEEGDRLAAVCSDGSRHSWNIRRYAAELFIRYPSILN